MDGRLVKKIKAPYPYFGGKAKVAADIWQRLGKTDRYIEPFFGSGAVMLASPYWRETKKEIINDLNHFVANFWRALQAEPDAVAYHCDYPTIECDLHSRHLWLVNEGAEILKQCAYDEAFYDTKAAGWWVWGMANWIGSHFAVGTGGWTRERLKLAEDIGSLDLADIKAVEGEIVNDGRGVNRKRPHLSSGQGVNRKLPHCGRGRGVNRKLPHLRSSQGVNRQLPHLRSGQGVNRQLPHCGGGRGVNQLMPVTDESFTDELSFFPRNHGLYQYIRELSQRFIEVDVCCGDWLRILKPAVTLAGKESAGKGTCAVFLDPPYSAEAGRSSVYAVEDFSVAHAVRDWCIEETDNENIRIALAGYDVEHAILEKEYGWEAFSWSANGGYSNFAAQGNASHANKKREVIWFSPSCSSARGELFNGVQTRLGKVRTREPR